MRFRSLGSGSRGNATLVEASGGAGRLLVDAGLPCRELLRRLAEAGVAPEQLDGIFLTHEHGDHAASVLSLMRRHRRPVWTSRGTWQAVAGGHPKLADLDPDLLRLVRDGQVHEVAGFILRPFTVPHDAAEPLQLCIEQGGRRLGLLTDTGQATPHLLRALQGCDALLLECNHDPGLLAASAYPASLKARIGGPWGHLANGTAARILEVCAHPGLRHVVAAHLSQQTNRPELARAALEAAWAGAAEGLHLADAESGCAWIDLG